MADMAHAKSLIGNADDGRPGLTYPGRMRGGNPETAAYANKYGVSYYKATMAQVACRMLKWDFRTTPPDTAVIRIHRLLEHFRTRWIEFHTQGDPERAILIGRAFRKFVAKLLLRGPDYVAVSLVSARLLLEHDAQDQRRDPGRPPNTKNRRQDYSIKTAVHYHQLAVNGWVRDANPIKTIATLYKVTDRSVRSWCLNKRPSGNMQQHGYIGMNRLRPHPLAALERSAAVYREKSRGK